MKPSFSFLPRTLKALLAAVLALSTIAEAPVFAEDSTNSNGLLSINISDDHDSNSQQYAGSHYFGLPKEAFDKLSAGEILELAKNNRNDPHTIGSEIESVLVPLGLCAMAVCLMGIGAIQRYKRQRILHETIRIMIEKGQPIPPQLLQPETRVRLPTSDLRRGLIFIAVGLGTAAALFAVHERGWPIALIPLLIGVAFLITWKIEKSGNK